MITASILVLVIGLFIISISFWFRYGRLNFSKICPFLLGYPFYFDIVVLNSLIIFCIFAFVFCNLPFSFLILLIWFFSLFFLMSLAKGLSILFILSKSQLLVLLIFTMVYFIYFSFTAAQIIMISFLLLILGYFFVLLFRVVVYWMFFLVSWGRNILLLTSVPELPLLPPIGFELSCFHCHLFLEIFWFPFWFLQ